MKRKIEEHLLKWKNDTNKRPLMIYGNKQVGKTYSVLKFGEEYYKNTVYFNTDNNIELYKIFKRERTIDRIISHLSVLSGESILEGDTLIVFDNLTDPDIASGIKVFGRNKHNYHIILISSLKENIKKFKCEEFQYRMMMSLDFEEYLTAIDNAQLIDFIKSSFRNNKPMPFHSLALEYFDDFLMTGGMPEAVELSINQRNKLLLNSVYDKIIDAYKKEISTLDNLIDITRSIEVLDSVPFQLQKREFLGGFRRGFRHRDFAFVEHRRIEGCRADFGQFVRRRFRFGQADAFFFRLFLGGERLILTCRKFSRGKGVFETQRLLCFCGFVNGFGTYVRRFVRGDFSIFRRAVCHVFGNVFRIFRHVIGNGFRHVFGRFQSVVDIDILFCCHSISP